MVGGIFTWIIFDLSRGGRWYILVGGIFCVGRIYWACHWIVVSCKSKFVGRSVLSVISWLWICARTSLNTTISSIKLPSNPGPQVMSIIWYHLRIPPSSRLWAQHCCDLSLLQLLTYPFMIWQCKSTIFFDSSITLDWLQKFEVSADTHYWSQRYLTSFYQILAVGERSRQPSQRIVIFRCYCLCPHHHVGKYSTTTTSTTTNYRWRGSSCHWAIREQQP